MTLRHRLLLVYSIVVLLSGATVGVAVFELRHARQIIRELQDWNGIALHVEQLKTRWPPPPDVAPEEFGLREDLGEQFAFLSRAPDYLDVDRVREALRLVYRRFDEWKALPTPEQRASQTDIVQQALGQLSIVLQNELHTLNDQAATQEARTNLLLAAVAALTVLHVLVIGSLLRRWLLDPMERLNRQVEALGRDEPPKEPLLTSPREMATLAQALDRARESLGALRRQLLDSERLTVIGQFAAQLAHNLRNPLASIRAVAQVTGRQPQTAESLRQRMDEIIANVDRLNRWVTGLAEIARRDPTATRPHDVLPTLHHVRDAVTAEVAAKELTLTVHTPAEGLVCDHDPPTLEHVLVAMVVNAIEASPLGAGITLEAGPAQGEGRLVCRIAVRDAGCGLPADEPERIFDFSYSTKQRGMGLGLALARQALARQGGATHAVNNPEGGATVWIELPMGGGEQSDVRREM